MKRAVAITAAALTSAIAASYAIWSRTAEGRICGRFVREELAHYNTSHASANPRIR